MPVGANKRGRAGTSTIMVVTERGRIVGGVDTRRKRRRRKPTGKVVAGSRRRNTSRRRRPRRRSI